MIEVFKYSKVILFSFVFIALIITTCFSKVSSQTLVPGIHALSMVKGVLFTWVIVSSDNEISINLRYTLAASPPPLTILATALTNSQNSSNIPSTMGGSQVLDANWSTPSSMTIKVDGSSSLYDADLITVVASPYGSSPPSIPIPTTENITQIQAPTESSTQPQTQTQNNCDPSYPDFSTSPENLML